jgi:hypothetical protein
VQPANEFGLAIELLAERRHAALDRGSVDVLACKAPDLRSVFRRPSSADRRTRLADHGWTSAVVLWRRTCPMSDVHSSFARGKDASAAIR